MTLSALLAVAPVGVRAATVNWIAPSPDSYANTAAWSTGGLPGTADTAVVGNATVATGSVLYTNTSPGLTNTITSLLLGNTASSSGTFTLSAGQLSITNTGTTALIPGNASGASGTFIQNGGTLNVVRNASTFFQDSFTPGNALTSTGTFTLNGGTANFLCGIELGIQGTAILNVNNGTLVDNGWFGLGRGSTTTSPGNGTFNLSNGTVYLLRNPGTDSGANGIAFCQSGTNGVFNMSGGTLYANAIRFAVGPGTGRTDYETVNISGGNLYLSGAGVVNANAAGTHNISVQISGGTFHTVDLGPNTGGTQVLASVLSDGTNWSWAASIPATLTTTPGPGFVTFAPETNRTITLNNSFTGAGGLTLSGPGTLSIGGANSYSGATTISGGTISGTGSIQSSPVTVTSSGTVAPGTSVSAGTLTLGSSLTLNGDTNIIKLAGDPTQVGNNANDLIAVLGNLNLSGVSTIKIVSLAPLSSSQPYTIFTYTGTQLTSAAAANLHVISANPRYSFAVVDPSTTPGTIQITVTGNSANLVWRGGAPGNPTIWDNSTTNWVNTATSALDDFFSGDAVTFDDTGLTNLVTLAATEQPVTVTLANNSLPYTFAGAGPLISSLNLTGTGSLTLATTNAPILANITNNSARLIFNLPVAGSYAVNAAIVDSGSAQSSLIKANTNTLILGGNSSTYTGSIYVTNGVLQYTNASALGGAQYPLYVTNNGTLDLNNVYPGLKNLVIAGAGYNGAGALISSTGGSLVNNNGVANVALAADSTFASASRFDLYQNSFQGNGYKLTLVGVGTVIIIDEMETSLGDIHVTSGRLGFQGNVTIGDPSHTALVESNAILTFYGLTNSAVTNYGETKNLVLNGGAALDSGGFSNNFNGPITLNGPATNLFGTRSTLHIWNTISGAGGFILGTDSVGASGGDLYFDGANSYSGPTIISNRTLFIAAGSSLGSTPYVFINSNATLNVSALSSYTFTNGQSVTGAGTFTGSAVFASGSTLTPGLGGTNAGALTLSGALTLQAGSTTAVAVYKTTGITNSRVTGLSSVSIGGTLVVNATGTALANGDAIPLFSAGSYTGSFASISPATPGSGLTWNTSTLATDGTLRVVGSGGPTSTPTNFTYSVTGTTLTISWPTNYIGWTLQGQTNASSAAGLTKTNWFDVPGSSSTNVFVIPVDITKGSVFYRMVLHQ